MWKDAPVSESSSDYGRQSPLLAVSSSASVTSIIRDVQSEEVIQSYRYISSYFLYLFDFLSYQASSVAAESIKPAQKKSPATSLSGLKPFDFIIKPKVAPIKVCGFSVPLSRSIARDLHEHWVADLGFYKGRGFKLSFGPQNTLMVPNTFNNLRSAHEGN